MRQWNKRVISVLIIPLLLMLSFPIISSEDRDQNGQISLKDVVLSVKALAYSVEQPSGFKLNFSNTVHTLNAAAGIKTVICKDEENSSLMTDFFCLLPTMPFVSYHPEISIIQNSLTSCQFMAYMPLERGG